jgi:hypothetical protein
MPEDFDQEPLEQRKISLTSTQWAWLDGAARRSQSRSVSAELRRLIESERTRELEAAAA